MKIESKKLNAQIFEHSLLIGIRTFANLKKSLFMQLLNDNLGIDFCLYEDKTKLEPLMQEDIIEDGKVFFSTPLTKKKVLNFPIFYAEDNQLEMTYFIICNYHSGQYKVGSLADFNFLFYIKNKNETHKKKMLHLITELNQIPEIQIIKKISLESVPEKKYFSF